MNDQSVIAVNFYFSGNDAPVSEHAFYARHPHTTELACPNYSSHGTAYSRTDHYVLDDAGEATPLAKHGVDDKYTLVGCEVRSWRFTGG